MDTFAHQIAMFNKKFAARYRATAREAVQEVVSRAQVPGPSIGPPPSGGAGGRMPIVTGFLRASIQAATGAMPSGPTENEMDYGGGIKHSIGSQVAGTPISAVLLTWDPNLPVPFYVGWTASYASPMEYRYGFLRGAAERWDVIVEAAAKKMREQLG